MPHHRLIPTLSILLAFFALSTFSTFFSPVYAQTVFVQSGSKTYANGETFEVDIKVTATQSVTAARIYINFDNQKLLGQSIDTSSSSFTTAWPEATFDNSKGLVKLQASQRTPGVSGDLTIARLRFKATGVGSTDLNLNNSSLLLTISDTNLITEFGSLITITVTEPTQETSSSLPSTPGGSSGSSSTGSASVLRRSRSFGSGTGSSTCAKVGDVDCNGQINILDLARLLSNWRKNYPQADFSKNGTVDIVDLSRLLANWRK